MPPSVAEALEATRWMAAGAKRDGKLPAEGTDRDQVPAVEWDDEDGEEVRFLGRISSLLAASFCYADLEVGCVVGNLYFVIFATDAAMVIRTPILYPCARRLDLNARDAARAVHDAVVGGAVAVRTGDA